jgi:hypothetical protein
VWLQGGTSGKQELAGLAQLEQRAGAGAVRVQRRLEAPGTVPRDIGRL